MSHQTFEHFQIYHEKEKKSKLHTLKYEQDFFLLASGGLPVLEFENHSKYELYRFGKKKGWGTEKGRDD